MIRTLEIYLKFRKKNYASSTWIKKKMHYTFLHAFKNLIFELNKVRRLYVLSIIQVRLQVKFAMFIISNYECFIANLTY